MAYKARFRPAEILMGGIWRVLTDNDYQPLPVESLVPVSAD
jgi:arginyl-tRNA--protein-N-Asp/Glu arginylyltransferase